jgi:hypothetical protein
MAPASHVSAPPCPPETRVSDPQLSKMPELAFSITGHRWFLWKPQAGELLREMEKARGGKPYQSTGHIV